MRSNIFIVLVVLLVSPLLGLAQNVTISGTVISDDNGMGIPGVSIGIKESGKSTVTDISGRYELSLDSKETIICSYLGFIPQEILVKNKTEINIRLVPNLNSLDEIVVVGYGSVNKPDLTGNVSKIEGDEIANIPVPNFQDD